MPRIQFTLYWALATLLIATMLIIGTMIGRADAAVLLNGVYTAPAGDVSFAIEDTAELGPMGWFISSWQIDVGLDGTPDLQLLSQHVYPQCTACLMDGASYGTLHFLGGEQFSVRGGVSSAYDAQGTSWLTSTPAIAAVPEPATWVMLILAFGFISLFQGKKFWRPQWS